MLCPLFPRLSLHFTPHTLCYLSNSCAIKMTLSGEKKNPMRTLRLLVYLDMLRVKSSPPGGPSTSLSKKKEIEAARTAHLCLFYLSRVGERLRGFPGMLPHPGSSALPSGGKLLLPDPSSSQVSLAYKKGARCLDGPLNPKATKSIHFWATDSPPDIAACDHLRSMMLQIHPSLYPHHCTIPLTHP